MYNTPFNKRISKKDVLKILFAPFCAFLDVNQWGCVRSLDIDDAH